jgi:hypothetical protein
MPATKIDYYSYEEAKTLVRKLRLESEAQWRVWSKSKDRDPRIPANPYQFYKKRGEWVSMGDWLGTERVANQNKSFESYENAKRYAQSLKLKRRDDWTELHRTGKIPDKYPASPESAYKDKWEAWGVFLGTGRVASQNYTYVSYSEAQRYFIDNGIKTKRDLLHRSKENNWPIVIPKSPWVTFKQEWVSWNEFVQTKASSHHRKFVTFSEARDRVRGMGIKSQSEYRKHASLPSWPIDIPKVPWATYKKTGEWTNLNDFLGTRPTVYNREFRAFLAARDYVRSLRFKTQSEYVAWARSESCPTDIPVSPSTVYADSFINWADWLGNYGVLWTKSILLHFLKELVANIDRLDPASIYKILSSKNNCLSVLGSLGENHPLVMITRAGLEGRQTDVSKLKSDLLEQGFLQIEKTEDVDDSEIIDSEYVDGAVDGVVNLEVFSSPETVSLPDLTPVEILEGMENAQRSIGVVDDETVNFLLTKGVARLWQSLLSSKNLENYITDIRELDLTSFVSTMREQFLEEFDEVINLELPANYSFEKHGQLIQPNLMQRLVAHRLIHRKRVGNWSGTGAGKTLAAILGAEITKSNLTVIVALNNTVLDYESGWAKEIKSAFPSVHVELKNRGIFSKKEGLSNYLLLNYESFQLPASASMVKNLVNEQFIDFIVLDEIHSAKARDANQSKRRQLLNALISEAFKKNPELRVLGMSATPVINSLEEAVSLLETVTSREFSEISTKATVANALDVHHQLVLNGVRYRPPYEMELAEKIIDIKGDTSLVDQIVSLKKGDLAGIEKLLLTPKLQRVMDLVRPGTIIYSHFVDDVFDEIRSAITQKGLSVGIFSGLDKSGLKPFLKGDVDVLIGSSAMGTGVDGLQYVCDRLIVITLPWTSAAYEQLIGRIYRQNSRFERIEVFIPQVVLDDRGMVWSWDQQRFNRICYKKTLADAAVDGFIPEGKLSSETQMFDDARKALAQWIGEIESGGGLQETSRRVLSVPLPLVEVDSLSRRFGYNDFSQMNAKIGSERSQTTNQRFRKNPEEWYLYHSIYREKRKQWREVPYERIAEWLKKRPDWVVGDFGCGEALLAEIIPNTVHSFDHVAVNDSVTACDISSVPLQDECLDVVIFSLSLMGLDWKSYIKEASRVLRSEGHLYIAEPTSKWQGEKLHFLLRVIKEEGFLLLGDAVNAHKFTYVRAIKS